CQPFLVTASEDGKVLLWSNDGHDAIETLNVSDRILVDAAWVSPRQIAVAIAGARRHRSLFYKSFSLSKHALDVELRRVRAARGIGSMQLHGDVRRTGWGPPRFVVHTRSTISVFESGKTDLVTQRSIDVQRRAQLTAVSLIDSQHLVASIAQDVKLSKEAAEANPNGNTTVREERLLLYDLTTDAPPQELVLPRLGGISRLKVAPSGDRIFGCTRAGRVFYATVLRSADGQWQWADTPVQVWKAHPSSVNDLVWLADRNQVATVGDDGSCAIWNPGEMPEDDLTSPATAGHLAHPLDAPLPDVVADSQSPQLGQRLLVSSSPVTRVTASITGDRIVTVGSDRVIRIWDTHSGLELIALQPRKERVVGVEFSPDDRYLMIAEANSRIEVIRLVDESTKEEVEARRLAPNG
uniref:WD40 repeat domain-containing protein n=1 Tax=Stieleria sp. TaxID=2795976 RepID=UPI0035649498